MSFDLDLALNVVYPSQVAAHQIMENPNPPLPSGYTLLGALEVDRQRAADLLTTDRSLQSLRDAQPELLKFVDLVTMDTSKFGLVAYNAQERTSIVSIRGTETTLEWIANFTAIPAPFIWKPELGRVHAGFQLVYATFRDSLHALMSKVDPLARRCLFSGHSLGAALALIAAADLESTQAPPAKPELYTFAGPRAGTTDFAANFPAIAPICYRIVNIGDLVPLVPLRLDPPFDYEHVGTEQLVNGGFSLLNPMLAHLLETYYKGLLKLKPSASTNSARA